VGGTVLTEKQKREIERLKNVAIRPHWASDTLAQAVAIEVIASHGIAAVPALFEISERAVGLTRRHALDMIAHLNDCKRD